MSSLQQPSKFFPEYIPYGDACLYLSQYMYKDVISLFIIATDGNNINFHRQQKRYTVVQSSTGILLNTFKRKNYCYIQPHRWNSQHDVQ